MQVIVDKKLNKGQPWAWWEPEDEESQDLNDIVNEDLDFEGGEVWEWNWNDLLEEQRQKQQQQQTDSNAQVGEEEDDDEEVITDAGGPLDSEPHSHAGGSLDSEFQRRDKNKPKQWTGKSKK